MRIIYDGFIYTIQQAGGINRYFANLIDGLPESCKPTLTVDVMRDINFPLSANVEVVDLHRHRKLALRPRRIFNSINNRLFANVNERYYQDHLTKTRSRKFDLAHPTYYELLKHQSIRSYKCPVVVTVYDMLHEKFMRYMDEGTQEHVPRMKRDAIDAATAVICISESTKRDLMEIRGVPEEKITVTYLASDFEEKMAFGEESVPERPYFLFVGSRAKYKNFDLLLSAFKPVAAATPDLRICVVGARFTPAEEARIAALGLSGQIDSYQHPTDTHLAKLYRCSLALVYPSLYEGFGIPPLEAMISGTVVVAANTSSIPEVVGNAGLLIDPTDEDALTERLAALAAGTVDREGLIAAGKAQAKQFHWKTTVQRTVQLYESIV